MIELDANDRKYMSEEQIDALEHLALDLGMKMISITSDIGEHVLNEDLAPIVTPRGVAKKFSGEAMEDLHKLCEEENVYKHLNQALEDKAERLGVKPELPQPFNHPEVKALYHKRMTPVIEQMMDELVKEGLLHRAIKPTEVKGKMLERPYYCIDKKKLKKFDLVPKHKLLK